MKTIVLLLSCLLMISIPFPGAANTLVPILRAPFTDVTGTISGAEEINRRAEAFRQQTGIAPYILVVEHINEASLRRTGKTLLRQVTAPDTTNKGSVLLVIATKTPQILLIGNWGSEQQLPERYAGLLVENHTLAYLHFGLPFQGINTALDVLEAALLHQPTPPLKWYAPAGARDPNDPPGSALGFLAWIAAFVLFTRYLSSPSRLGYALKFATSMTVANLGYQALCLCLSGTFSVEKISLLWAVLIGLATFAATWLWTRKWRKSKSDEQEPK